MMMRALAVLAVALLLSACGNSQPPSADAVALPTPVPAPAELLNCPSSPASVIRLTESSAVPRDTPLIFPLSQVSASPGQGEGEQTVAVNPRNPLNVIVGSNQWQPLSENNAGNTPGLSGVTDCAVWSSVDGGLSWQGGRKSESGLENVSLPVVVPGVPGEFDNPGNLISADQNTVYTRDGTAYYQCINFGTRIGDIKVFVYRSADGGQTWEAPVEAFSESATGIQIDRPYLAVDNSGGPRDGTLYLTWETMFYQAQLPEVYARKSSDQGQTWGPVVRLDSGAQETLMDPRQYPVVGADGTLYVVYATGAAVPPQDPQSMDIGLKVARSTDGAASFQQSTVETAINRAASPDEAFDYFREMISAIATDPARPGRVAVAWPDDRCGEARILMRYSLDGTQSWSDLLDINDNAYGQANQHDHIALAYAADGRLFAVWRDRRASGGAWTDSFEVFARVFIPDDQGHLAPGPTVRISLAPQDNPTGHHGSMPDEYLGLAVSANNLHVSWTELDGSLTDNVYRELPLSLFNP